MSDPDGILWLIFILIILLLCYLLTAAETGAMNVKEAELERLAKNTKTKKSAKKLLKLREDPNRVIARMRVCRIALFLASGGITVRNVLSLFNRTLPESSSLLKFILLLIAFLLLDLLLTVFGFILPKNIAMRRPARAALSLQWFFSLSCALAAPLSSLCTGISHGLLKLFGVPIASQAPVITEEEILMMVDEGEESGVLEQNTKDMIENIFDFHDTTASEIMTHRTDVTAVKDSDPIEKAAAISMEKGYSRLPVYHDDIDDICGVIYIKDLLPYIGRPIDRTIRIGSLMRKAYFVPESKQCGELFHEMTEKHTQIAIIIDEYGGTEGIVTMEDLLEEIVGNIQDEYDNENEDIRKVSENVFTVEGTTPIDEISDLIGTELPEGEYDTVAGFVVELLGRLPEENEHPSVEWNGLLFSVEEMDDKRISHLRITAKEGNPNKS